jgi:hypothetical protein
MYKDALLAHPEIAFPRFPSDEDEAFAQPDYSNAEREYEVLDAVLPLLVGPYYLPYVATLTLTRTATLTLVD